jgi:hypothetical protein
MISKTLIRFWLAPKSEDSPKKKKIWKVLWKVVKLASILYRLFKFFEGDDTD